MIKSEFRRNIVTLITGTVIAQSVPVLLQPVLRRIFSTADFGVFAVYLSLVGMFSVVSCLRYEMAIVLPKENSEAVRIFSGSMIINVIMSCLFFLIVLIFSPEISIALNLNSEYYFVLYLVPFSILLLSAGYAANFLLVRSKNFKAGSVNKVTRRLSEGSTQTSFGFFKVNSGLIWGDLIGHIFNIAITFYQIKKEGYVLWKNNISEIRQSLRRYKNFPLYNTIPTLLNSVSILFPVLLISHKFAAEITGQFDLSRQVLALPLVLISGSISQVLFQKIVENRNKGISIKPMIFKLFFLLFIITAIGIVVFYFIGIPLFGFVFGTNWTDAALYTNILIFSYGIKFVISTLSIVLTALEKLKVLAIWQVFYFFCIVMLSFVSNLDIFGFLKLLVIIDVVSYIIYAALIYRTLINYETSLKIS